MSVIRRTARESSRDPQHVPGQEATEAPGASIRSESVAAAPQLWMRFLPGQKVEVARPNGYTYSAYVDAKTEDSKIIWIRSTDLGTRHLVDDLDGTRLTPVSAP